MIAPWLGLYLLTIAALTLFPFVPPACGNSQWTLALLPDDMIMNALLFIPVGLATHRTTLLRTTLLALALSLAIEISQQWLPRSPDFTDLATNSLGAAGGWLIARAWVANSNGPLMNRSTEDFLIRSAAFTLVPLVALLAVFNPDNDFSNWERAPLVVGNETVGDRGWSGDLLELSIYDRALEPLEVAARPSSEIADVARWKDGGPVLRLDLALTPTVRLDGPDGETSIEIEASDARSIVPTVTGLRFAAAKVSLPSTISDHVFERLQAAGALTVDARIRPLSIHQQGPARILSFGDEDGTNLVLAQKGSALVAHIRTPSTEDDSDPQLETRKDVVTGSSQTVTLTYDGHDATMFVDGVCRSASKMSIGSALPLLGAMLGGTLVACCALSMLAVGRFYRETSDRLLRGIGAGALTWSVLYAIGAWEHVADFDKPAMILGALSLAMTLPMLITDRLAPMGPELAPDDSNKSPA